MKLTNENLTTIFKHLDNGIQENDLEKVCPIYASVETKYQKSKIINFYNLMNKTKLIKKVSKKLYNF